MEINSHQKLAHSMAVANSPPSQAARLKERQPSTCPASSSSASTCNHHNGWPCGKPKGKGQAMLAAWAPPAIKTMAIWRIERRLRDDSLGRSSKDGIVGSEDTMLWIVLSCRFIALQSLVETGETLNHRTAPPLVCSTVNCRPASE